MKLQRLMIQLGVLTLAALLALSTQAATIELKYNQNLGSSTPSGHITGAGNVYAGEFEFEILNKSPSLIQWDDELNAFCIQTSTTLKNSATYNVVDGLGAFTGTYRGMQLDRLFSEYYTSSKESAVNSAAMQLAIWEIVNESPDNPPTLSSGNFTSGNFSGARGLANNWLASLNETSKSGLYDFYTLTSSKSQDLITVTARVPEPSILLMFGLGLLAMFGVRRRRH
ncbi:PEP-CTERM sorting domain-containing protein [Marinimicrobium alkaliphilum]|uniref:PEP-CTERM sorting domain-containing protein n=1 Tax=Marinimicrobium alkaliphilum TaxID=2202654 RepID=UPI0013009696|nr:PEP-CTERM sorting domain-containing protein [Marinimicrobium alkaliphilum]